MANETCPGRIPDVAIIDADIFGKDYRVCAKYDKIVQTGFIPSPEFCPSCEFNGDSVRQRVEEYHQAKPARV